MTPRPLTKALHTVRVVERVAAHLVATHRPYARPYTTATLLSAVLDLLGNEMPTDAALMDACCAVCARMVPP